MASLISIAGVLRITGLVVSLCQAKPVLQTGSRPVVVTFLSFFVNQSFIIL
jgi:hypothetical protein